MNFLSRDVLYQRGLSKTTYRGTWNRSNVWPRTAMARVLLNAVGSWSVRGWRLGPLCRGFQPRTDGAPLIGGITGATSVRGQPYFAWKRISDRGSKLRIGVSTSMNFQNSPLWSHGPLLYRAGAAKPRTSVCGTGLTTKWMSGPMGKEVFEESRMRERRRNGR